MMMMMMMMMRMMMMMMVMMVMMRMRMMMVMMMLGDDWQGLVTLRRLFSIQYGLNIYYSRVLC